MALSAGIRHVIREIIVWSGVLGAGFAAVFYFDDVRTLYTQTTEAAVQAYQSSGVNQRDTSSGFERSTTLRADRSGHFFARAHINGRPLAVLVDTGATAIALSYEDAKRIGLEPRESDFTRLARTANGVVRTAPITLDAIRIGDVEVRNLRGSIAEPGNQHVTLLGMEFIRRLGRFEMRGRELILVE